MGLTRKTTILLSEALHRQLTQLAHERGKASESWYARRVSGRTAWLTGARLAAVEALGAMRLPVEPVEQMIGESATFADLPN